MFLNTGGKRAASFRRLIAAAVFLSVFVLPLHLHAFSSAAQITKECSCLHGSRIQLASAPPVQDGAPAPLVSFVFVSEPMESGRSPIGRSAIRAPPVASAL